MKRYSNKFYIEIKKVSAEHQFNKMMPGIRDHGYNKQCPLSYEMSYQG